jgi:hypothetical protein
LTYCTVIITTKKQTSFYLENTLINQRQKIITQSITPATKSKATKPKRKHIPRKLARFFYATKKASVKTPAVTSKNYSNRMKNFCKINTFI